MSRRRWLLGAGLTAAAALAAAGGWPRINDVTTGQTPEYPDLQPQQFSQDAKAVMQAVESVAASMPGWHLISIDQATRTVHAEARVLLTPFIDDVTVNVEPVEGGSRVWVRSRSRVGRGDLGVNARRIRAFQRALNQEMNEGTHQKRRSPHHPEDGGGAASSR